MSQHQEENPQEILQTTGGTEQEQIKNDGGTEGNDTQETQTGTIIAGMGPSTGEA